MDGLRRKTPRGQKAHLVNPYFGLRKAKAEALAYLKRAI
jgi:hypothetical protein